MLHRKVIESPASVRNVGSWKARKSDVTRQRLIDATLWCLANVGYTQTTVDAIAVKSGVSRGCFQHQFHDRSEVVAAAVRTLNERRLVELNRLIDFAATEPDRINHLLRIYWNHLNTSSSMVFRELTILARIDPFLKALLRNGDPAVEEWNAIVHAELKNIGYEFNAAIVDCWRYALEGLALKGRGGVCAARLDKVINSIIIQFRSA